MGELAQLKRKINRNPILRSLVNFPYRSPNWDKRVAELIRNRGVHARILDIGSGIRRRAPHVINLEIEPMQNINVVGDGHNLPFRDEAFDVVILEAVLEHVREPKAVVSEVSRVLKPGGWVCVGAPFIQGYHASPEDYQRFTVYGLEYLFSDFQKIESGSCVGPTSALHWIFREYIGILLSFGNIWVYKGLSTITGWITFPFVFLDLLLIKNKNCHNIASAVYFIGKKTSDG